MTERLRQIASTSLIALILLSLAWESWLAPLRPGGSLLILKAVPLLLPLHGVLRGKIYTYQWACMFVLLYFTEGVVRAWADVGMSARLATMEIVFSLAFFASAILYVRVSRRSRP